MKKCKKCGEDYLASLDFFYKSRKHKDGLETTCKECRKAKSMEAYYNNKEEISEKSKIYYKNNRKKILERTSEYYQENKEYYLDYSRKYHSAKREHLNKLSSKYYRKNKDKIIINHRRYYEENKDRHKIHINKRRNLKKGLPSTLTIEQWVSIKKYFNNKCAYCDVEAPLAQDHFIPLSKGGPYTKDNIIPSCKSCNSSKRDKYFGDWYKNYEKYDELREKKILEYLSSVENEAPKQNTF